MRLENGFTYSIVGYGRVGAALDAALSSVGGVCVGNIISRDASKRVYTRTKNKSIASISDLKPSDFVFICVPDDAIETVAKSLPLGVLLQSNSIVTHVSGSKSRSILDYLAENSIQTASSHPLMTFKTDADSDVFEGITVSLEGDFNVVESLGRLFKRIGSKPIVVTPEQKKLLHLAAVITSNFMSSLVFHASEVLESVGENPTELTREIFGPLMMKTAENIIREGYPSALTGPASRGDSSTIHEHINLLKKLGIDDTIYRELTNQILHYKKHK